MTIVELEIWWVMTGSTADPLLVRQISPAELITQTFEKNRI